MIGADEQNRGMGADLIKGSSQPVGSGTVWLVAQQINDIADIPYLSCQPRHDRRSRFD
jgi:hypothetical protein